MISQFNQILTSLTIIIILSACTPSPESNIRSEMDTVIVKIGDQHISPTPNSSLKISFKNIDGERITRFYSDSTYELFLEHELGVKVNLFAESENFNLVQKDSSYILTTVELGKSTSERLKIGYMTDTTSSILIYHYRMLNEDNSSEMIDFKRRIDTIGFIGFKLIGRNED